jgi:hypothetical protein
LLNDARACAARDSEDDVEDMMEAGRHETEEELLADISVVRMWGYLEWAAQNAAYLGPWTKRPSEDPNLMSKEVWMNAMLAENEWDDDY